MKRLLVLLLTSFGLVAMAPQNGDAPVRPWPTITVKSAETVNPAGRWQVVFEPAVLERLQSKFLEEIAFSTMALQERASGKPIVDLPAELNFDQETFEWVIRIAKTDDAARAELLANVPSETLAHLSVAFDFLMSEQLYKQTTIAYITGVLHNATAAQLPELREQLEGMLHRACTEPFQLTGDQACLLFWGLTKYGLDPKLTHQLEEYTKQRLLNDAEFFAESLAPAHVTRADLPACALSLFLEKNEPFQQLLPAHLLRPELVRTNHIPGEILGGSKDGRFICVQTARDNLYVYNIHTMQPVNTVALTGNSALFSPDGQLVVLYYLNGGGTATLYATHNMQPINATPVEIGGFPQFSPDSRFLVLGLHGITLHYTNNMQPVNAEPAPGNRVTFSPDSQYLLLETAGGTITLCSTNNMQPVANPVPGDRAEFSPDGHLILVKDRGTITLYTVPNMQPVDTNPIPGWQAQFSSNSQLVLVHNDANNGEVTVYTAHNMQPINANPVHSQHAEFSPDGQLVSAVENRGRITLYTAHNMQPINTLPVRGRHSQFSPDSRLVWVENYSFITLYTAHNMQPINTDPVPADDLTEPRDVAQFSPNGKLLVVHNGGGALTIFDTQNMHPTTAEPIRLAAAGSKLSANTTMFSPDGQLLAVESLFADLTIRLYTTNNMRELTQIPPGFLSRTFSPFGQNIFGFPIISQQVSFGPRVIANLVALWDIAYGSLFGQSAQITTYAHCNNTAEQMAVWAAIHREHATGDAARLLDERTQTLADALVNAPAEIQKFFRAHFPAPGGNCCVQ